MSTSSRRVLAVTVAAIIAVLTGITAGLLSAQDVCRKPATSQATTAAPGASPSAQAGVAQTESQAQVTAAGCQTEQFRAMPALAAVGGALLAGVLVLLLVGLAGRSTAETASLDGGRAARAPTARPGPETSQPAADARTAAQQRRIEADRQTLVRACIYVRDRVTSKALADRLGAALHDVGVSTLEPAGERFDPSHHEAGSAAPSDDPDKVGRIAAVEVPGYSDRGRILRAPVVTVYQAAGARASEPGRPGQGRPGEPTERRPRHAEREDR